jgi:hypothetical protein
MKKKLTPRQSSKPQPEAKPLSKRAEMVFKNKVDVPDPTPEQAKARAQAVVVEDFHSHCAIELRRIAGEVFYVIFRNDTGVEVEHMKIEAFDRQYKPVVDYPAGRAAKLMVGFAQQNGGCSEAMAELLNLVNVTKEEIEVATAKATGAKHLREVKAPKEKKKVVVKKEGVEGKPRESAATRFKALIMEGKLTDDEIFTKVQAEFSLGEDKRKYVAWYRNALKKAGQNPPTAKFGKEAVAKEPKKAKGKKSAA